MSKWLFLFLLASPTVVRAEMIQPNFTQGSMNSTTTTTIDIDEEIVTTTYGHWDKNEMPYILSVRINLDIINPIK